MPLTEPVRVGGIVLDRSMDGWDWTDHAFIDGKLTVGHYYQPHPPSPDYTNNGYLDHYLVYRNYTLREPVEFQVSRGTIAVSEGSYEFDTAKAKGKDFYSFRVPNARSPIGSGEGYRGPIGHLRRGQGRIQTTVVLERNGQSATTADAVRLESDGDWSPMQCPCCARLFHLS
ncbi:MAG: hypothetical protein JWP75_2478 [Frondihabitans sp.]|nr:hypothetical protein [Frondihabitans sp.]